MARRRKTSSSGALRGLRFYQPFMGFKTQYRVVPLPNPSAKGKKKATKPTTISINYGGSCRQELIWDVREELTAHTTEHRQLEGSWESETAQVAAVDLDHPSLKQPLITYLWINDEDGGLSGDGLVFCRKPCCLGRLPHMLDAFVGSLAVILNPDRYEGDWWKTSVKEASPCVGEIRWYGTDNFFLRHPVLTSLMMGMFRQAFLLHSQGFDTPALEKVDRKEVEECLTNSDPQLALRILNALRPWIGVKGSAAPFPEGTWDRVRMLQRAIYRHGYDELFGDSLSRSWNTSGDDRYAVVDGPGQYWGATLKKPTVAGKLLAKLGK
jgi:hypothetical protein